MKCDSYGYDPGVYFRVLVNQSPQPLACADGPGESCSIEAFKSFTESRAELYKGYTAKCEPSYKNSTDVLSIFE
jgi:acid phosphatase